MHSLRCSSYFTAFLKVVINIIFFRNLSDKKNKKCLPVRGRKKTVKKKRNREETSVKHRVSGIMLWGCVSFTLTGKLVTLVRKVVGAKYRTMQKEKTSWRLLKTLALGCWFNF